VYLLVKKAFVLTTTSSLQEMILALRSGFLYLEGLSTLLAGLLDSLIQQQDYDDHVAMNTIDTCNHREMSRFISRAMARLQTKTTLSTRVQAMYMISESLGTAAGEDAVGSMDEELLTEQCEICEGPIPFTSASTAKCQSGHQFSKLN
jgi:hypothetical protein